MFARVAVTKAKHFVLILAALLCILPLAAQDQAPVPEAPASSAPAAPEASPAAGEPTGAAPASEPANIPLIVEKDTPLRLQLAEKVRVKRVGQPVKARVIEDVYRFDRVVIPAGSEVLGQISKIKGVSRGRRTRSILNADFSPPAKVELEFDFLLLPDGKQLPIETAVTPGIPDPVRLVNPNRKKQSKAREALEQARSEMKRKTHETIEEIRAPGKMERVKDFLVGQLPYRPQSLRRGTLYEAALTEPLDFGSELVRVDQLAPPGTPPPGESEVKARLLTPLDSATTQKDAPVEALITRPLFSSDHKLILPEGSRIVGRVSSVRPARSLHRNGQLQLVLNRIEWPSGEARRVEASLDSVEVSRSSNMALDSEGGTTVKDSKTRYVQLGLAITAAALASTTDSDDPASEAGAGHTNARAVAGGFGFRLVGLVAGYAIPSRAFSTAMGIYGAGWSFYDHFLSRGRDVVFQKDTPMEISFGAPEHPPAQANSQ